MDKQSTKLSMAIGRIFYAEELLPRNLSLLKVVNVMK